MKSVELLMPAGNFEKMQYAFAWGADAVYLGIPKYSLRARENGFIRESVAEAIDYAHQRGKKVYVTANIIPHNRKVTPFIDYVGELLQECRPDAWIMSDPGVIMLMRERYPDEVIHLSVQANTVNWASARFWQQAGVQRIILSRELSIREIAEIHEHCPGLELEAFVHGSICIAYSGRCLISNYMSSRDPNQGTCTNSCRWEYKMYRKEPNQPVEWKNFVPETEIRMTQHGEDYVPLRGDYYLEETERPGEFLQIDEDENGTYLMNARDLCGIEYLHELRDAGVVSFKVEGRSKSLYYAALISRAYRRAIDDMEAGKPFDRELLRDIFATANRGLISGFLKGNPGRSAQKFDSARPEHPAYQFAGIIRAYDPVRKLIKVEPRNPIRTGMTLELVTPEATTPFVVRKIFKESGEEITAIHGGLHYCWLPAEHDPGEFALLRELIDQNFDPQKITLETDIQT